MHCFIIGFQTNLECHIVSLITWVLFMNVGIPTNSRQKSDIWVHHMATITWSSSVTDDQKYDSKVMIDWCLNTPHGNYYMVLKCHR